MSNRYLKQNVYEAARERLDYIFAEFGYVYVSFSGGKDSGVLLELALDYVREHGCRHRLGVFHIDYEAQYQMTTDYVQATFDALPEWCDKYWCAMPISAQCCTSMSANHWVPWDESKKDIWVRDLPSDSINIHNHEFDFYEYGMEDYQFQKLFGEWLQRRTGKKTACLVGVRTDESYDRRIMIANTTNKRKYKDILWSTGGVSNNQLQYNFYPIYDWSTEDVWIYNGKFGKTYNRLYDVFYKAGLTIHQMRVASPFNHCAAASLKLYKVIEPNIWGKMVSRVNGVNFSGIYGGTTAMGWRSITKPKGHTWKSYLKFLLGTLPPETRAIYEKKFRVSEKFWTERGGVLDDEVVADVMAAGADVELSDQSSYKTEKKTVRFNSYPDDMDIEKFRAVPSYKRMCVCVLKNDHLCKYMGFTMTKEESTRRKAIMEKYKSL